MTGVTEVVEEHTYWRLGSRRDQEERSDAECDCKGFHHVFEGAYANSYAGFDPE